MEKHKCKLCLKRFVNKKALGGHMRSHMVNLYVSPKTNHLTQFTYSDSSFSDQENEEKEFGFDNNSVILQDRESETESSKNPTRRRSKRVRRSGTTQWQQHLKKTEFAWVDPEPVSSISDTTPEEDVAYCLMMLSRDNNNNWRTQQKTQQEEEEEENEEEDVSFYESENEYRPMKTGRVRGKYRCETCNKVFRSYQALGGHRASHKKIKITQPGSINPDPDQDNVVEVEEKIHECPVCYRVFSSGQALGGHKRSHVTGYAKPVAKQVQTLIDLNLPAPVDDDEVSQIC